MSARGTWMWAAATAAVCAAAAWGQFQVQGGGALDANPGLGTGKQNQPIRPLDTRINGQLYVDNRVTGLAGLHVSPGYRPFDEFQGNLPSAGQRSFSARSMGLEQALTNNPYAITPYSPPSAVIAGAQAIAQGRVTAGKTVPNPARIVPTVIDRLYTEAVMEYEPLMSPELKALIKPDNPLAPRIGLLPEAPLVGELTARTLNRGLPLSMGVVTGMADLEAGQVLSRELFEMQAKEQPLNKPMDNRIAPTVAGALTEEPAGRPGAEDETRRGKTDRSGPEDETRRGKKTPEARDVDRPVGMPRQGQDVFLDVLVLMQKQQKGAVEPVSPRRSTAKGAAHIPTTPEEQRQADVGLPPVEFDETVIRLHSLAGRGKDVFNEHKRKGIEKLRGAKFYEAIDEFQDAIIINPDDPTGHVGLALGTLGAGELLRSAVILRQAMERFPRMMELRYDILRWMDAKGLDSSLVELNGRVITDGKVNASLAALGAWVNLNVGRAPEAKRLAKVLKEAAPGDRLYAALAEYVLTGKGPEAPRPTTAPAVKP